MKQRIVSLVCLLMAAVLVLTVAGCNKEATKGNTSSGIETTSEIIPEPDSESRNGGWLDEITFAVISPDTAISKIQDGAVDIYAGAISGAANFAAINTSGVNYNSVRGNYYEIMLNPSDTTVKAKELNPFASRVIREAMNWLIDRDYICQELFSGTAIPKYIPQSPGFPDYERYLANIRQVEARYAYDSQKAVDSINEQMIALGAQKNSEGIWIFKDSPVVITALIRNDDNTLNQIGDYVCNELVRIGFTVERKYMALVQSFSIWSETDPAENEWNLYTGAWGFEGVDRDGGSNFQFFYSPASEYGYTDLYKSYTIDDEFYQICEDLSNLNFVTKEDRDSLYTRALDVCNTYSFRIWICDSSLYIPMSKNVTVFGSITDGVAESGITPFTLRFKDQIGGSMVWANSSLFHHPVNPVGGSDSEYDSQYMNFTQDYGLISDPLTGRYYKQRIQSADVVVQTGLPVSKTYDWVDLSFRDEIVVPADAMIDWDAVSQTWKTASKEYLNSLVADAAAQLATVDADKESTSAEIESAQAVVDAAQAVAERGYLTAKRKSVVTYPKNLYDVLWHDGSNMSAADFMMCMIVAFDLGSEESAYYDPSLAEALKDYKQGFKGWKIVSTDPLTIEYYSDVYHMDAEANIDTMWPDYGSGQSNWADMAVSLQAAAGGGQVFTQKASEAANTEWLDWLSGPSLKSLEDALVECIQDQFIPYEPTMKQYVTMEQANHAYDNILNFYSEYGHFFIGCGPYFISSVDKSAMTLTLRNFDHYIDLASKWSAFMERESAFIQIDGPDAVSSSAEAQFTIAINLGGGSGTYPSGEIEGIKYIVFNADGAAALSGEGQLAADGQYKIILSPENIATLGSGICSIEVAAIPVTAASAITAFMKFTVQ